MKTVIVLLSLAIFASAIPTIPRGNFDNINTGIENLLESKTRQKKSLLGDTAQELSADHGQENQQLCSSKKSQLEASSLEKKNLGIKKPIIIKKKLGYHVYQDSDEEMAHADPNENCRKQVKVKLCDTEPVLHTNSNNIMSITSGGSEKEMENSIKMAKEAVENLQRDLRKMESAKIGNSKENLDSNIELQNDIENARRALDHIQHNIGNIESIDFQLNAPKPEDTEMKPKDVERLNKWKEAIENIHKNFEIAKKIEDAFQLDTHNMLPSESKKDLKERENENLEEEEKLSKHKSEIETINTKDSRQTSMPHMKATHEDDKIDPQQTLEFEKTSDVAKANEENDMFVSTTDHNDSKIKLHSDSLTTIFDNTPSGRDETKAIDEQIDGHLMTMKSSEHIPTDLALQNKKIVTSDMSETQLKAASDTEMLPLEHNKEDKELGLQVENNEDDKSLLKSLSSAKSIQEKESQLGSNLSIDRNTNKQHSHDSSIRSGTLNEDQINSESKHLIDEKDASEIKIESFLPKETVDTHEIKTEQFNRESIDTNNNLLNMRTSNDAVTMMEGEEKKNEPNVQSSMLDINMPHQKTINNLQSEIFKNVNEQHDVTAFFNEKSNLRKQDDSYGDTTHDSHEFSGMRNNENDHFQLVQAFKSVLELQNEQLVPNKKDESISGQHVLKEEINARTNNIQNDEKKLNDKHEFSKQHLSRLAQDMQLQDNLSQFKSMASHNMHQINLPKNNNEFQNEQHMFNEPTSLRMSKNHETGQHLHENHGFHEPMRPMDHSKDLVPSGGLKERQTMLSRPSMRFIEGKDLEDLGESQNINNAQLMHWAHSKQNNDHFLLNDHMMQAQAKDNGFHNEHSLREHMNMQMTEDQNSGQQFIDSHELYDPLSMRWAGDHQHNNQMTHPIDTAEFHNEPHMNHHLHEHMSGSRFNNNHFDLDGGHDFSPMRSLMHSQPNMMKHASDIDNAVQPSMHIGMRDSNMQWGHHHHGMARTSFPSNLPMTASPPDAVGVFPNANTGCGIPLLLSCSPSIVSGTMAKARPTPSTPAYRSGDDFMFYMKRDTNNFNGVPSIKTKTLTIPFKHKTS